MRRNIVAHGYVDESIVDSLREMDFVFVAVDKGRSLVVEKLEFRVPFIDVGMGVEEVEGSLLGQLRVSGHGTNHSRKSTQPCIADCETRAIQPTFRSQMRIERLQDCDQMEEALD